ncbi:PREDICTED: uncharacterized protein LOC107072498 [Polistes dominula]|uniref:Uncharacterized protein LOC107072498 n=1 Tax=Polistes dominula TaxID=743375 RepID=A0ABM1J686_POLDO|nr:PREDICTED: uncharacterized protein LOC107072498 [Polistes dominula]
MNTWKKQKLQISNNKQDGSVLEENNKYTNLNSFYESKKQSNYVQMNYLKLSKSSLNSQSRKCTSDFTKEPDYIMQLNTLKNTILNRREKVLNAAQNLLMLSSYLQDLCNSLSERKVVNPDVEDTTKTKRKEQEKEKENTNLNINKKVDKSTSPILFSENNPVVRNNLTEMKTTKTNSRDMYTYNPYRNNK